MHLTQRGASWASGAAQAAQFVRIILRWRGVCTIKPAESLPGGTIYPPYMRKIIDAGGFKAYEKDSCKSFMALLAPKLPYHLPPEVVEIVVMFSFHVGFY